MHWQYTPYAIVVFISAVISIGLAVLGWRRRAVPGANWFTLLMISAVWWSTSYGFELSSADLPSIILWNKVQYLGIVIVPVAWLGMIAVYTNQQKWREYSNLAIPFLLIVPVITVILIWTNERHELIQSNITLVSDGGFTRMAFTSGPWYWVLVAYSYIIILFTMFLLIEAFIRSSAAYRKQISLLLSFFIVIWLGNASYVFGLTPAGINLTPVAYSVGSIAIAWGLFRYQLLDIAPIARDAVLQGMKDAVIALDAQKRIVELNPAAQKLIGQSASEIIGRPLGQALANWPELAKQCQNATKAGTEIIVGAEEGDRFFDLTASPLYNRRRQLTGQLITLHDITRRVQAEQSLQHAHDAMKRAKESAEKAQHAAEAANRAKSIFLSNMSHELRTPLNAIIGFSQLMFHNPQLPPGCQENLGTINRSGEHLLTLINDILDMSKIEAGRTTLNKTGFDLHRLLDDLEDMFRLKAREKNLHLTIERAPNVPRYIRTDMVKLRQVLINLFGNAVKFTDEGSVTLRIWQAAGTEREGEREVFSPSPPLPVPPALRLFVSVEDTGPGVAPDEVNTLFDPFVQAKTDSAQQGTGLGLSISQKFVQLMGGEISVISPAPTQHGQNGPGTLFQFDIHYEAIEAIPEPPLEAVHQIIGLEANQPCYRILVADDAETSRQLLVKLLEPIGFEVQEAANGQEAVEIWAAWHPHLIWMDMRMPVMDGYKATKQIKSKIRTEQNRDIEDQNPALSKTETSKIEPVIIALTASALGDQKAHVLAAGCDDFLSKPFQETDIFIMMSKYIGARYVYASATSDERHLASGKKPQPPKIADSEDIKRQMAGLSPDWLAAFDFAASTADTEACLALLKQLNNAEHLALVNTLSALVNDFRFDKLILYTQNTGHYNAL